MLNLLKNSMPHAIQVRGIFYNIDYYFNTALAILDLLNDDLWTPQERFMKALDMFFPYEESRPAFDEEAIAAMLCFLNGGDAEGFEKEDRHQKPVPPVIDFDRDGNMIYTAFLRVYNIDLSETSLHWWKFKAMLDDLGETTALQTVIRIRTTKMEDVPEKSRADVRALKAKFSLGDMVHHETLEERNARWRGE